MRHLPFHKRVLIALAGYLVVALFILVFFGLRRLEIGLSSTEKLILAAVLVTPLILALLWEHLKGLKVGEVEITLSDVAPTIDVELASAIQDLQGSGTPALVQAITGLIGRRDLKLVEVNLRAQPYWWSTRLYLLAALAVEYANIERVVFVEGDALRLFVGTAAPNAIRSALGQKFPDLETIFAQALRNVRGYGWDFGMQVLNIGTGWSASSFSRPCQQPAQPHVPETQVRELVTSARLAEWLPNALETETREWKGEPAGPALYAKILSCNAPFVPLLNGRRLEKVVDRNDLAIRIATSSVS